MSKELILITGGSGHIGFRTVVIALESGYRVRLALRSRGRFDAIRSALARHHARLEASLAPGQLSFVIVPDMTVPGAYDEAVNGVSKVIHIASSITTGGKLTEKEYHDFFIKPATRGTMGMLEAAAKAGTVKRVVITASVVAVVPFKVFAVTGGGDQVFDSEGRVSLDNGPYGSELQAYCASKVATYNGTLEWLGKAKPSFDVVHLCPTYVMGRDDLQTSAADMITGTNALLLSLALGKRWEGPKPGATVHNDDVAKLHVQALSPDIPSGTYMLNWQQEDGSGTGVDWSSVPGLIEKLFPEAAKAGKINPQVAMGSSLHTKISSTKTEKTFNLKLQGIEEQIRSVVGQYLELLENNEGK
ncbi:hypothetical protein Z517_00242 [Fonsecaea pedrosoi CBS 271.37]|uniref:NAD-dependent epimerase/dehydratase domain-containing protein n=1 Tax=Fonsecaea pedrosoi CBS 271.37 TaxID=1442368 RepID=A0A0D2HK23_9EURO|nr:uncharacterized protein Z517_00242 [Fonsecaea pedrosoi CBS 271.37]KIW84854.1 hypothetical protein Z517_00242 [Fonsecaea pedrosoi CBS 271.37]